tara:strand:+ start:51 stop:1004 length:954 start_codon:yes stop_codon:yes gene_type:complete
MSEEVSTTPVADVSTSAVSDAASTPVGDVAGEVTAEETQSAAESSSQSDGTPAIPTESGNKETEPANQSASFAFDSWNGEYDTLPERIRDIVSKKQKDLEAGYTPKFQELANQRKAFEAEAKAKTDSWKTKESQYALYKAMYEGREDPRIAEMKSNIDTLTQKYETEKKQWADEQKLLQKKYVELEDAQDASYVKAFRERHATMLGDEAQKAKFTEFVDKGWDLDVAAVLPNKDPEIVKLATEFARKGIPHEQALDYAELKVKGAPAAPAPPRKPRVGAKITNGATPSTNPARIKAADYDNMSLQDAYLAAAKKAIR